MKFLNDITTGKDNYTHDVTRSSMAVIVGMLPFVMLWGMIMETLLAIGIVKTFDMQGVFNAVLSFLTGAGAFLLGGGASLFLQKKTDADGSVTETEAVTKGKQPDIQVNNTVIQP